MQAINAEQAAATLRQGSHLPSESRPSVANLPPNHPIWELWQRLTEMYGHRWTSQQGEDPNDTWLRGLADVTPKQFGAGLRACCNSGEGWPPTLPEFRALCVGGSPDGITGAWGTGAHRIYQPERLLDSMTTDERKAKLAAIRAGL